MSAGKEDWLLWMVSDSALPTGGFVASAGLEAAVQTGHIPDTCSLLSVRALFLTLRIRLDLDVNSS